ncbi:hypothetical protein [Rhizobium leguminosarum]|uniref:hypothetical protein n=1 Tax=Rhizobium leguminosarum TaxID=384 RepID=UPI003F989011
MNESGSLAFVVLDAPAFCWQRRATGVKDNLFNVSEIAAANVVALTASVSDRNCFVLSQEAKGVLDLTDGLLADRILKPAFLDLRIVAFVRSFI